MNQILLIRLISIIGALLGGISLIRVLCGYGVLINLPVFYILAIVYHVGLIMSGCMLFNLKNIGRVSFLFLMTLGFLFSLIAFISMKNHWASSFFTGVIYPFVPFRFAMEIVYCTQSLFVEHIHIYCSILLPLVFILYLIRSNVRKKFV